MKSWFLPSADSLVLQWLGLVAFLILLAACMGGIMVWMKTGKHGKSRRKHRKHKRRRSLNPTLAQTGGLPPKRDPNLPPPGP